MEMPKKWESQAPKIQNIKSGKKLHSILNQVGDVCNQEELDIMMFALKNQPCISERFRKVVVLHMLKNILRHANAQVPLLLGIHGPTGEGKTFQVENILKNMGAKRFLISGGQLDSPISGQPAQLIRTTYIKASESIRGGESTLAVVLVNDIDTGLGSWGDMGKYSINQQTIYGELMHLVDYPNTVEGRDTQRVPIIITGNDFTRLYEPLVRAGRMVAFEWIPNVDERSEIVASIFPEMSPSDCEKLILALNKKAREVLSDPKKVLSIALYSHLRSNLLEKDLWGEVDKIGVEKTVDMILKGREPDFSLGIRYDRVLAMGMQLIESGQLVSHIRSANGL